MNTSFAVVTFLGILASVGNARTSQKTVDVLANCIQNPRCGRNIVDHESRANGQRSVTFRCRGKYHSLRYTPRGEWSPPLILVWTQRGRTDEDLRKESPLRDLRLDGIVDSGEVRTPNGPGIYHVRTFTLNISNTDLRARLQKRYEQIISAARKCFLPKP